MSDFMGPVLGPLRSNTCGALGRHARGLLGRAIDLIDAVGAEWCDQWSRFDLPPAVDLLEATKASLAASPYLDAHPESEGALHTSDSRLMAATVERLRPIGPSRAESQRRRRAEDRDDRPVQPRKADCTGCVAARAADSEKRLARGRLRPGVPASLRSEGVVTMWAVVELMGHRTRAGAISDATMGGATLLRIEHPTRADHAGTGQLTEYYAPAAIFSIRPCSEEEAAAVAGWAWGAQVARPALGPAFADHLDEDYEDEDELVCTCVEDADLAGAGHEPGCQRYPAGEPF